ncbi:MAG: gamma-glutamyltransferase [Gammaproteobacteria bacterium]|nr:gamma-glutamyltransferase [Gammaproteobacteria bacterium]MCP5136485.1 gamma-glutamyltransferase [Gammaproteobacteria bacterium]
MNKRLAGLTGVLLYALSPALWATDNQVAIASAHPLATESGLEILAQGGNAFDAAIAVSAALAVVEPYSSGIGGGGFYLLHRAEDGLETFIDARERAPLAATRNMYLDAHGEVIPRASMDGPLAAGIPGVPAGLAHLAENYGALPLAQSLAPAIRLAREGFSSDAYFQGMAQFRVDALRASPEAARLFLDAGAPPRPGKRIVQSDLADTLQQLAERGRDGFYAGDVAQRLIRGVRASGGIWSARDLSEYQVIEREPIRAEYRGMKVISAPPPSSGGVALAEMLNILADIDLRALDPAQRSHWIVEAMRRAYRDRAEYLGDPDFVQMPLARLLDPMYAAGLRAGIRGDKATPSTVLPIVGGAEGQGRDTTHFSILDAAGNRVAATLSVNYPFGSGFVVPGTGVLLNDEMDDFSAKPGVPNAYGLIGAEANAIAPGKRMLSSMTPSFLEYEDRIAIAGTPGGSRIITMMLLAALDFWAGADADGMVSRLRFHHQFLPDRVQYEDGVAGNRAADIAWLEAMRRLGHDMEPVQGGYGNMQVVVWNPTTGAMNAASDPRGIGKAEVRSLPAPEPGPQ